MQAPRDRDAEQAVLGALLYYQEPRYVHGLTKRGLEPAHFFWQSYGHTFASMIALAERDIKVDPISVSVELERKHRNPPLRRDQIDMLVGCVPTAGNLSEYALRVRTLAFWRGLQPAVSQLMLAVQNRDSAGLSAALSQLRPSSPPPKDQAQNGSHLRLVTGTDHVRHVDANGQVLDDCPSCLHLGDQLKGAHKEIRAWRTRYADLERRQEQDATTNELWPHLEALFELWQQRTGHVRSQWTPQRFYEAEPMLRRYGMEVFERAIAGIAYDPFTTIRKNGSHHKHDSWTLLCSTFCKFEEYVNKAPKNFKPTLSVEIVKHERKPLKAIDGGASA